MLLRADCRDTAGEHGGGREKASKHRSFSRVRGTLREGGMAASKLSGEDESDSKRRPEGRRGWRVLLRDGDQEGR